MSGGERHLAELREAADRLRAAEKTAVGLRDKRNELMKEAVAFGLSERTVAEAVGVGGLYVHQVVTGVFG